MCIHEMRKIPVFLFLFFYSNVYSQQDPYFSSYSFNPVLINSSLASFEEKNYATAIYRNQWTEELKIKGEAKINFFVFSFFR